MKKNLLILLGIAVPAFGLVSALACYLLEPKPDPIDVAALVLPRDTGSPMAVVPAVNDPDPPESDKQLVACLRAPGNGGIWDIAITPDGKVLATTCGDSTIKLWNLQRRKLIAATLTGHDNPDGPIAISPDGKSLAWGRNHGQVQFWDLRRNIETLCLRGHSDRITALCFSRDGSLLTSASRDEVVRVWELTHRVAKLKLASGMEYPTSLSFSPDGRRLACAGQARFVRIWDLPSGAESALLRVESDSMCVVFLHGGKTLAYGTGGRTINLWNVNERKIDGTLNLAEYSHLFRLAAVADGTTLAAADSYGLVKVWKVSSRKELSSFYAYEAPVTGLGIMPDGAQILTANAGVSLRDRSVHGEVRIWKIR